MRSRPVGATGGAHYQGSVPAPTEYAAGIAFTTRFGARPSPAVSSWCEFDLRHPPERIRNPRALGGRLNRAERG